MSSTGLPRISKLLSFVLRHDPGSIGLTLDPQGWASVDALLAACAAAGKPVTREELRRVVDTSDKKRFTLSPDGARIRAAQGHSVPVELGLPPQAPPPLLYHGTATRFVEAIFKEGLKPQSRQHVHLSADETTALRVGQRHGKPALLVVRAGAMHALGFRFYQADNGVWLTDHVPPPHLERRGSREEPTPSEPPDAAG